MPTNLSLTVLGYSVLAASMAVLGVVPLWFRRRLPVVWLGWANALAAGLMLGSAYVLMHEGLDFGAGSGALGAVFGVGFVFFVHLALGTEELDLNRLEETNDVYGYQVWLVNALHSACEGVAIGAALAVSWPSGIVVTLAIAVHNVPEATVLAAVLSGRGLDLPRTTLFVIASDASQVLLAVATFAVVTASPGALGWVLGFAVGALVNLTVAELLPECYRQAGRTSIAMVTLVAMGMVVLLGSVGP